MSSIAVADALSVLELRQYTLHPGRRDELDRPVRARIGRAAGSGRHRGCSPPSATSTTPTASSGCAASPTCPPAPTPSPRSTAARPGRSIGTRPTPRWSTRDNVLLLRPLGCDQGLQAALQPRPAGRRRAAAGGVFTITVCPLREPANEALVHAFDQCVHPWWVGVGGDLLACWVTEPAANNFPRLPVREGEPVVAWLTRFDGEDAQRRHAALLRASGCLEARRMARPSFRRGDAVAPRTHSPFGAASPSPFEKAETP